MSTGGGCLTEEVGTGRESEIDTSRGAPGTETLTATETGIGLGKGTGPEEERRSAATGTEAAAGSVGEEAETQIGMGTRKEVRSMQIQHAPDRDICVPCRVVAHSHAAVAVCIAIDAVIEHSGCQAFGAGARGRDDRGKSQDRDRTRQKAEVTEAKAEEAAAAEPNAGVILEVRIPPCSIIGLQGRDS